MNNILNAILFISLGLFITSCEKKTGFETPKPQLKIIEADVTFETQGDEGFIKLEAPGTVTAYSNEDWCSVSISGTTIKLTAEANTGLGGRSATITIQSGNEIIDVTAVQTAAVMWFKDFTTNSIGFISEGSTVKTAFVSSFPISVESKPDWITYKIENDSLYLTATPGIPRKGIITFSSEARKITYDIVQVSYVGLLGEWEMEFNNPSKANILESTLVTFEEKVANSSFLLKDLVITGTTKAEIIVNFNPNTNNVTINAGQNLMTLADGRVVYLSLRSAAGKYTWEADDQLAGELDIASDGKVKYIFGDNGTWSGNISGGFGFYIFKGEPPSSANATGTSYKRFMNIVMTKK